MHEGDRAVRALTAPSYRKGDYAIKLFTIYDRNCCPTLSLSFSQQTPLHTAAKQGNQYTVHGLIKLGAKVNIKDKLGVSETILPAMDWFEF